MPQGNLGIFRSIESKIISENELDDKLFQMQHLFFFSRELSSLIFSQTGFLHIFSAVAFVSLTCVRQTFSCQRFHPLTISVGLGDFKDDRKTMNTSFNESRFAFCVSLNCYFDTEVLPTFIYLCCCREDRSVSGNI